MLQVLHPGVSPHARPVDGLGGLERLHHGLSPVQAAQLQPAHTSQRRPLLPGQGPRQQELLSPEHSLQLRRGGLLAARAGPLPGHRGGGGRGSWRSARHLRPHALHRPRRGFPRARAGGLHHREAAAEEEVATHRLQPHLHRYTGHKSAAKWTIFSVFLPSPNTHAVSSVTIFGARAVH